LFSKLIDEHLAVNNVNVNKQTQLQPVDVNKQFTVANAAVECGDLGTVKLNVNADVKAHADVALGVVATGTLVPPTVSAFSLTAGLNAELDGSLSFVVGATVSHLFFKCGADLCRICRALPSTPARSSSSPSVSQDLIFPGTPNIFLSFQPSERTMQCPLRWPDFHDRRSREHRRRGRRRSVCRHQLQAAERRLRVPAELRGAFFRLAHSGRLAYALPCIHFALCADSAAALSLSVSPNVTASGSLQAHLIPALNFGLSALGGKASATVFFQLDSSATVDLSLSGSAGTIQIAGSSSSDGDATATATSSDAAASATDAPASTTDADSAASTADAGASASLTDSDFAPTPTDSAIASSTGDAADASATDESADATPTATDDGLDPTATDDGSLATPTSAANPDSSADGDVAAGDDSVDGDVAPGDDPSADGSSADASDTPDNASADSSADGADDTATAVVGDGEDTNDSGDDSAPASDPTADGEDTNNSGDDSAAASDPTADGDASGSSDDADDSESSNNGDNSVDSTEGASDSTQDSTDDADAAGDDDDDDADNADGVDDSSSDSTSDDPSLVRRDAGVSGCVDAKLGVEAQAGSKGSFFGLFDTGSKFTIFSKEFELFKVCRSLVFYQLILTMCSSNASGTELRARSVGAPFSAAARALVARCVSLRDLAAFLGRGLLSSCRAQRKKQPRQRRSSTRP
jgi:hypothetical protein